MHQKALGHVPSDSVSADELIIHGHQYQATQKTSTPCYSTQQAPKHNYIRSQLTKTSPLVISPQHFNSKLTTLLFN